jgi:hypothetical protein
MLSLHACSRLLHLKYTDFFLFVKESGSSALLLKLACLQGDLNLAGTASPKPTLGLIERVMDTMSAIIKQLERISKMMLVVRSLFPL